MADTCRACGQEIDWGLTAKKHRIPLDKDPVSPDEHGAMILVPGERGGGSVLWAYSMSDLTARMAERLNVDPILAAARIMSDYEARRSHFATCPKADERRRRRSSRNS